MPAHGFDQKANLKIAAEFCQITKEQGADIAFFPERYNVGYTFFNPENRAEYEAWLAQASGRDDEFVVNFRELARRLEMAIGITYLEKWQGAPRNSFSLIDRHDNIVMTYAKVYTCVFDVERFLTPGDDFYGCDLDTAPGRVKSGAMICYDREFPESARVLMLKKVFSYKSGVLIVGAGVTSLTASVHR
jgi:predicted amidohydrolase